MVGHGSIQRTKHRFLVNDYNCVLSLLLGGENIALNKSDVPILGKEKNKEKKYSWSTMVKHIGKIKQGRCNDVSMGEATT